MKLKRKYLKQEEMLTIDNYNLEISLLNQRILNKKYEIELLNYKIKEMQNESQCLISSRNVNKEKLEKFTNEIKKQCGIKEDKWGFDPDSGEIKI